MDLDITTTKIGSPENTFPMLKNVWDFFITKGTKTVFFSIGSTNSPLAELDFAEMVGCPIHIFETEKKKLEEWNTIKTVLQSRKLPEDASKFVKESQKKWVLYRNVNTYEIDSYSSIAESISKISPSLDLLKISVEGQEISILNRILESGYRPSLILISWTQTPDDSFLSMCTAGHLCMLGYVLIGKENNNFLYYFTDANYYEICHYNEPQTTNENILVRTLTKAVFDGLESKNKPSE